MYMVETSVGSLITLVFWQLSRARAHSLTSSFIPGQLYCSVIDSMVVLTPGWESSYKVLHGQSFGTIGRSAPVYVLHSKFSLSPSLIHDFRFVEDNSCRKLLPFLKAGELMRIDSSLQDYREEYLSENELSQVESLCSVNWVSSWPSTECFNCRITQYRIEISLPKLICLDSMSCNRLGKKAEGC